MGACLADRKSIDLEQHARFVETARALGCDESEEAFDEKLKRIADHRAKDAPKKDEAEE